MKTKKFKIGDKVVCVKSECEVTKDNIYIIDNIYETYVSIFGVLWIYEINCFISLSEQRKLKLKNLKNYDN